MDFDLTEEQRLLQDSVARLLGDKYGFEQRKGYLKSARGRGASTAAVAARVLAARQRQAHRLRGTPWLTNGEVPGAWLRAQYSCGVK